MTEQEVRKKKNYKYLHARCDICNKALPVIIPKECENCKSRNWIRLDGWFDWHTKKAIGLKGYLCDACGHSHSFHECKGKI